MKAVLLPGLDGTGTLHSEFVGSLPFSCQVLSYPTDAIHYDVLASWAAEHLPAEPFILIAESFSGPIALELSELCKERLKGVVFVASFARAPIPAPSWLARALNHVPLHGTVIAPAIQALTMGRWASPEFSTHLLKALEAVPTTTLAGRLEQVLRADYREKITKISAPMHYLQASSDRLVPGHMGQDFAAVGASLTIIDGPHFLLQANPSGAAAAIAEFAKSL